MAVSAAEALSLENQNETCLSLRQCREIKRAFNGSSLIETARCLCTACALDPNENKLLTVPFRLLPVKEGRRSVVPGLARWYECLSGWI